MQHRTPVLARVCLAFALVVSEVCASAAQTTTGTPGTDLPSYDSWQKACRELPANRMLQGRLPPKQLLPLTQFADFEKVVSALIDQNIRGPMSQGTNWVLPFPEKGFFDPKAAPSVTGQRFYPFQPFAQKLDLPANAEVFFRADLHGDIHSLLANLSWLQEHEYLRGFEVQKPNFFMVFLGDYTDRGSYGIEVLYTLFRLKLANPDHVFFARGNHEDINLQARYGFAAEGQGKYGRDFDARVIYRLYDLLPVVVYTGSGGDFIQCNHGGMEPGYNPRELLAEAGSTRFQLLGSLNQAAFNRQHPDWMAQADSPSRQLAARALQDFKPEDPISPSTLGFMWNDFSIFQSEPQLAYDPGRAFVYGEKSTAYLLNAGSPPGGKLHAVFRGHQQSPVLTPMMRRLLTSGGVFRHWQANDSPALSDEAVTELAKHLDIREERPIPDGSVWTFNVSPDSIYGEGCHYTFDSFGILRVAPRFEDWRLRRVNVPVRP